MKHASRACAILAAAVGAWAQGSEWTKLMRQGEALEHEGKYVAAAELYKSAGRVGGAVERGRALNMLGALDVQMGLYHDAGIEYCRALAAMESALGKESVDYAVILGNIAMLDAEEGQVAKGEVLMRQALDIQMRTSKPDDLRLAAARNGLAQFLVKRKKYTEAEQLLRGAIAEFEHHPGSAGYTAVSLNNLGVIRQLQNRQDEARELLRQCVALLEKEVGPEHPYLLRPLGNLGVSCGRSGHGDEAEGSFQRALAIAEKRLETDQPVYALLLHDYAAFLRRSGDKARAKKLEAQSQRVRRDASLRNGTGLTVDVSAFQRK